MMGHKSTHILNLIIYLLGICVGCFGSHNCGGIGTIGSLTVTLDSCGQLSKTCVVNNVTGDSTYRLKVDATFTITNRKNYSDLVYKVTAIPSDSNSSGVNTILLTQDKAGTFSNNVTYHLLDTLDIPFNFSQLSSTNETWTTQMVLASSKNLSEAIICETLPMFDTITIKAKNYGDTCQNPYEEPDECAPLFACRPTTDGQPATCTCIDGQTLEKNQCKKYVGTLCDQSYECILNAECITSSEHALKSCACKTGYDAATNFKECTKAGGGEGDGGGASSKSSSLLGLLIITISILIQ